MAGNEFNKEIAKPETHGDAESSKIQNPLHFEATAELASRPQTPQIYRDKAIQYIENEHDDHRKSLPPDKLEAVRAIEKLIVNADSQGLTDKIHTFAGNPVEFENAMNAVVRDLMSVGVRATWNYSTRKDRSNPTYDPIAPKDIGNFTLENVNPVGATTVRYSTEGEPQVHSTETEAKNSNVDMKSLASAGLRRSANIWLKRVID
ncbi:MAG: hypothetical protein P4L53_11180 [Candidatus Obscuribacterales bacterium]|nr:hypothetical protein [Candidatus Obscuribacterales bacterium]